MHPHDVGGEPLDQQHGVELEPAAPAVHDADEARLPAPGLRVARVPGGDGAQAPPRRRAARDEAEDSLPGPLPERRVESRPRVRPAGARRLAGAPRRRTAGQRHRPPLARAGLRMADGLRAGVRGQVPRGGRAPRDVGRGGLGRGARAAARRRRAGHHPPPVCGRVRRRGPLDGLCGGDGRAGARAAVPAGDGPRGARGPRGDVPVARQVARRARGRRRGGRGAAAGVRGPGGANCRATTTRAGRASPTRSRRTRGG